MRSGCSSEGVPPGKTLSPSASPAPALQGLARGMAWVYVQVGANFVLNLFLAVFILRRLGAVAYGYTAMIVVIAGVLGFLDAGLGTIVSRATARMEAVGDVAQRATLRREVETAHASYLCVAGVGLLVAAGTLVVAITADDSAVWVTAALVAGGAVVSVATSTAAAVAVGRRRFRLVGVSAAAGVAINLATVVLFVQALGIVAVGLGVIAGALVSRGLILASVVRDVEWFALAPVWPGLASVRHLLGLALPLLLVSAFAQLVNAVDLLVVGSTASVAAAGLYRLGSLLPAQAVGVLYRGYDVVFPYLAGTDDECLQEESSGFLTRVASYIAGAGFLAMIILRSELVASIAGSPSRLASNVLALFCAAWLLNVPVHGLSLLLFARGQQRVLTGLVVVEAFANIVLTVVLVYAIGAVGAAWATLVTLGVSNAIVLPALVKRRVGGWGWRVAVHGLVAAAVGGSVGSASALVGAIVADGFVSVVVALALVVGVGLPLGIAALGSDGRRLLASAIRAPAVDIHPRPVPAELGSHPDAMG